MDTVDETLAAAERAWRAYGVRPADRAALAADLRLDLESAAADGVGPEQLLGEDVPGFARRLADEAGARRMPPELPRIVGTALTGAALGASLGYVIVALDLISMSYGLPVQVAVGIYYGVPAAIVVAGAVATVWFRLRDVARIRETARAMTVLLPVAGLAVTPVTMGLAWTMGYSTAPFPLLLEVALVAGTLAGAVVLARRWALREKDEPAVSLA